MEPDDLWQISSLIILLFLSGFFSASETALMSLSKIRIRHMVDEKIKSAALVQKLVDNPTKLLGSILVGNNVVNIGASALATSLAIEYFGSSGVGIATGVMTLLVLIFGEITPKSLAAQNSESISLKVAKPISFFSIVLSPLIGILTKITSLIIKMLGGNVNKQQPFITEEEFRTMVNVSHEEGILEGEERQMIHNVFEFGDSQAQDVMIPRTDMIAIDVDFSYERIIELFKEEQFSRFPVYEETIDNIVGVLSVKDLIFYNKNDQFDIHKFIREPFFTFEFKRTVELFEEMRTNRIPLAIVLDEYGGTSGIITMEDLVEEIVGDIHDEYDERDNDIEVIKEDEYIVDGSVKIHTINEMLGVNIESEDFDSIGGFVIGEVGHLPAPGEKIQSNEINFIVEKVAKNRIVKLRILT